MRNLDEVINLYLSAAKKNEELAMKYPIMSGQCKRNASEHMQMANWLMELKELRAELNDDGIVSNEFVSIISEYNRLLKAAMDDLDKAADCICYACTYWVKGPCPVDCRFKWNHHDEAMKLMGEQNDENN